MTDLKFDLRQLVMKSGFTAAAARYPSRNHSLAPMRCPITCRDFEARDQRDIDDLVIVGFVMAINEHFATAGGHGDIILVLYKQTTPISHMSDKWAKWSIVKQLPDFIGLHTSNDNGSPVSSKARTLSESVGVVNQL
jgi:hypothetical protein